MRKVHYTVFSLLGLDFQASFTALSYYLRASCYNLGKIFIV